MSKSTEKVAKVKPDKKKIPLEGWRKVAVFVVGVGFLVFQLFLALVHPLDNWVQVPLHLCFALSIVFFCSPIAPKYEHAWQKTLCWILDFAIQGMLVWIAWYFITHLHYLQNRILNIDPMLPLDLVCAYFVIFCVLEAVRRTMGYTMYIFIWVFIAYAFLGQHLHGLFQFAAMDWKQFAQGMLYHPQGILGDPLITSVKILYYFVLFGAFFSASGSGQVLVDVGMKAGKRSVGGPAKAAVISSGLLGMISGSAMANVSTTGVITIPLMKKSGYTPEEAASIESVASTGGQIMPPIMGVGAFIMAEMIGVNYGKIAAAAIIPALAYFGSLFCLVHLLARKRQMKSGGDVMAYECEPILPRLPLLIPIIVMVIMIIMGYSLPRCALIGLMLSIVTNLLNKEVRFTVKSFIEAFVRGSKQAANIAVPTAACGIMIGIVIQSGVAQKLSKLITSAGTESLAIALILSMFGCILLGMAVPTVAAYLVSYILFGSTLRSLGLDALTTNMFMFYFGAIAQITPPVCLASYTAAGIADANSRKTGWKAFSFAIVAFLTPFAFALNPALLLEGTAWEIISGTLVLAWGTFLMASGLSGYMFGLLKHKLFRRFLIVAAVLIIIPGWVSFAIGSIYGVVLLVVQLLKRTHDGHDRDVAVPVQA